MPAAAAPAASSPENPTAPAEIAADPAAASSYPLLAFRISQPELPAGTGLPVLTAHPLPAVDSLVVEPAPRRPLGHRLVLGLLYSPDFSTVKFADVKSPGTNFGALLEYRFNSRLRLSTGLIRSDKDYRARREDYRLPYSPPSPYPVNYDWVQGTCTILDVPLNLRYDWLSDQRQQAFVSLGLSSFFMRREHYYYHYVVRGRYNEPVTYTWDKRLSNGGRHLLSVLNLSAGYERQLGGRWSLQAEPFVKVPLGGVGYGQIRLLSGGLFLGVKYGL